MRLPEKQYLVLFSAVFIAVLAVMYKMYNAEEKVNNDMKPEAMCDMLKYLCGNVDALRSFAEKASQYVGDTKQLFPLSENAERMARAAVEFCVNNAANFFCPAPGQNPLGIGTKYDCNAAAMQQLVFKAGCCK